MEYSVLVRNKRRYPVRVLIGRDMDNVAVYRVLRQYETYGPIQIDQAVFDLLGRSVDLDVRSAPAAPGVPPGVPVPPDLAPPADRPPADEPTTL